MTSFKLSIIVCTYNRAKILEGCLQALSVQALSPDFFEVVVIDNNSTDNTQAVAELFVNELTNFRLVTEYIQGLAFARNRGWKEALGEYVAYIDDDAEAFPDWVESIIEYSQKNPSAVAFGGPYMPMMDTTPPVWFPPEYGNFSLGETEFSINAVSEFLCGTNMVFKRDVLFEVGGFNTALGMSGCTIAYGEETRLQIDLKRKGYEIYYVPTIQVKHLLASKKMSFRWLIQSVYAVGRCSSETFCVKRSIFSCLCGLCYGFFYALRFLIEKPDMPSKRKLYYSLIPLVSEFAVLTRLFRRTP
jgi:glucosyl-dolichyl phosphate glucuronosyltransferase